LGEKNVRIAVIQRLEHGYGGFIDVYEVMESIAEKIEEMFEKDSHEAIRMMKRHGYRSEEQGGWADMIIIAGAG
jgi:Mg2+/Co2+ transporter CorC